MSKVVNCWEEHKCNDCPIDFPDKQCGNFHPADKPEVHTPIKIINWDPKQEAATAAINGAHADHNEGVYARYRNGN